MGIRINKSIGYFLSKADCKKLFVKDYRDILYEIKYGENSNFYAELIVNRLRGKPSDDIMHSFEHTYFMQLSMLSAESNAENVVDKLLTIVNMCDDYKGLLFQTIALNQENRRDECLDYYDNKFGFKCKKLNRGIYPYDGFRTKEDVTVFDKGYKKGSRISISEIKLEICDTLLRSNKYSKLEILHMLEKPNVLYRMIKESNKYYPDIAPEVRMMISVLELQKDNVSLTDVLHHIQPAIITTWG